MTNALRDKVLGLFDPLVARNLIGFGEHISNIDADYLIFMARKSLRLYDVMCMLGLPRAKNVVLSDRVLEFNPEPLRGKRVALIDDTLIVGTTLAKTKRELTESVGSNVSSHVFCVNTDWWVRDIFQPDTMFMQLNNAQVMAFCTNEVKALSALGIPYLLDFPFSSAVTVDKPSELFRSMDWDGHNLSTPMQEAWGSSTYSFLPSGSVLSQWECSLGANLYSLIDIAKVRAFGRTSVRHDSGAPTTEFVFVPIVTLKPISTKALDTIYGAFVEELLGHERDIPQGVSLSKSTGKARFVQYALSVAVGDHFLRNVVRFSHQEQKTKFEMTEAIRHFGPWLSHETQSVHEEAYTVLLQKKKLMTRFGSIKEEPTPKRVLEAVRDVLDTSPATIAKKRKARSAASSAQDILTDFSEIFIDLYDKHEIPARREAQAKGRLILEDSNKSAHRDRLNIGVPWSQIVDYICTLYGIARSARVSNIASLILDFWNDIGVAVPIFFEGDGVILRAYRHGEDVKITNQTIALVRELAVGFTQDDRKDRIPRLTLEKLIVSLFRVGLARDWFEINYTPNAGDGPVARVGYNLKGAVVFQPDRTDSLYARSKEGWLSDYCVTRGALVQGGKKGDRQYRPGKVVDANFEHLWVPGEARRLGNLYSILTQGGGPLSDDKKQVLLTTCATPHDVAAAIEAELLTISEWCHAELPGLMSSIADGKPDTVARALAKLRSSSAHEAVFSARLKFVGYMDNAATTIAAQCYEFLRERNPIGADVWSGYWLPVLTPPSELEVNKFKGALQSAASVVLRFATCLLLLEFALDVTERTWRNMDRRPRKAFFDKLERFLQDFRGRVVIDGRTAGVLQRLDEIRATNDFSTLDPPVIRDFALQGIKSALRDIATDSEHLYHLYSKAFPADSALHYEYLVWYDIIGSTGERFELTGAEQSAHRARVAAFQTLIDIGLSSFRQVLEAEGGAMKSWNGDIPSSNDEKHVFITGAHHDARAHAEEVLRIILRQTTRFPPEGPSAPGVKVRAIVAPCTFAGSSVVLSKDESEVVGKRFWPHWARLRDQLKDLDSKFNVGENILHVCSEALAVKNEIAGFASLSNEHESSIKTAPDGHSVVTMVRGYNATVL